MKSVIAVLFAIFAYASAGAIISNYGLGSSLAYSAPLAYSNPLAYSAPLTYSAPIAYSAPVVAAPAIQSGYVAATRGSVHTAPLPEGPFAFSHHLNTAPAAGTF